MEMLCLCSISLSSLLFCATLGVLCFSLWNLTKFNYWKVRGVPYLKPVIPLFGNLYDLIFLKGLIYVFSKIYRETKELPFVGIYAFQTPVLYVRDFEVIMKILVKDFHHFEDRGFIFNPNDSLGRNLIHQSGADWKFSRTKLSPCFSVSQVKSMLPLMIEKSQVFVDKLERDQSHSKLVDAREASLRYTTDVVTLCTIGVDPNSLLTENERFREVGNQLLGVHFILHVFTGCFFPRLHRFLGISVCKTRIKKFFHDVIGQTVKYRKGKSFENNDILNTLLKLKDESAKIDTTIPEIDDNFVAAQSFIFFLAGFESPGNILACVLHEIAKKPHIQEKLCTEFSHVLGKHGGKVTFDALQEMKYMKQVISEALRMYSPLPLIFRRCSKDYMIPGTSTLVEEGTLILIPVSNIQMDPEYYPDPEVFDPERFSDENSAGRHAAAFMPFGLGPRFCPAMLYSYMKIKSALLHILQMYEVRVSGDPKRLEPSAVDFLFTPKDGIHLEFQKRKTHLT